MCHVCGCSDGEIRVDGEPVTHRHHGAKVHGHAHHGNHTTDGLDYHRHRNEGDDHVATANAGHLHFGSGPAGVHVAGVSQTRLVEIEQDILAKNRGYAEQNRDVLGEHRMLAVNLISSPGAGKTTLLVATIDAIKLTVPVVVIEGDQESANDAERIRATGVPALQINTGRGCHLDAHMVGHALENLPLREGGLLFIENVGNLVCPVAFDLGEAHKITILSVTEGDDKPLKYPDAFAAADLLIISKIDLLPHVDFDVQACIAHARCVNPNITVIQLSARTGAGMQDWLSWLRGARKRVLLPAGQQLADRLAPVPAITELA